MSISTIKNLNKQNCFALEVELIFFFWKFMQRNSQRQLSLSYRFTLALHLTLRRFVFCCSQLLRKEPKNTFWLLPRRVYRFPSLHVGITFQNEWQNCEWDVQLNDTSIRGQVSLTLNVNKKKLCRASAHKKYISKKVF